MKRKRYVHAARALLILILVFILACWAFVLISCISNSNVFASPSNGCAIAFRTPNTPSVLLSKSAIISVHQVQVSEPEEPLSGEELYKSYVDEIAASYFPCMDTSVVKALIYTESRYQPNVASSVGAVGLMQVLPFYHAWRMEKYGRTDIWDPYTNILVGMDLLNELYQKYGSWYDVLYFYSGGDASYPGLIASRANQYR